MPAYRAGFTLIARFIALASIVLLAAVPAGAETLYDSGNVVTLAACRDASCSDQRSDSAGATPISAAMPMPMPGEADVEGFQWLGRAGGAAFTARIYEQDVDGSPGSLVINTPITVTGMVDESAGRVSYTGTVPATTLQAQTYMLSIQETSGVRWSWSHSEGRVHISRNGGTTWKLTRSTAPNAFGVAGLVVEGTFSGGVGAPQLAGQIGHPSSFYNQPVTDAPVHPNSAAIMAAMEAYFDTPHDFGADGSGGNFSMPKVDFNSLPYDTVQTAEEASIGHHINYIDSVNDTEIQWFEPNNYPGTSDWFTDGAPTYAPAGDYLLAPYHPSFLLQLGTDSHLYVVDTLRGYMLEWYKLEGYGALPGDASQLTSGIASYYPLNEARTPRGLGCTSSNAAGNEYIPFLLTPQDFVRGEINHAIAIAFQNAPIIPLQFIEPAQHNPIFTATQWPDPPGKTGKFIPYGGRMRLNASFDVEAIPETYPWIVHAKVVFRALQKYGYYHIDGTTGVSQIPAINDAQSDVKWHDIPGMLVQMLYQYWEPAHFPKWTDFELLDGQVYSMGTAPAICSRTFVDERGRTTPLSTYP